MPDFVDYEDAIALNPERNSLLMGNGFSIAQGGANFAYANLLAVTDMRDDDPRLKLFQDLDTVDFEQVMSALEVASQVELSYGNNVRAIELQTDADTVRDLLIQAVRVIHPGIQFELPPNEIVACGEFLSNFESLFTLNYDLLLYWVILNMERRPGDGFGLGPEIAGFRTFNVGGHGGTYYLHGALHLFQSENFETQKRVLTANTIVDDIARSIRARRQLPLFVAEGTTEQKESKIRSIPYLRYCLEALESLDGTLFIYGHSVDPNDTHVYDAIFKSRISTLVICVYDPDNNSQSIIERISPFLTRNREIACLFVDAAQVDPWGNAQ